ncbi:MAG: HAMP domain-containing protein [Actinobacteria bacterium]|uniref:Sensor histidine kinase MtrB n=1 Tax=freshwater metagenome TaxID=449393 RepID=A0A6J5YQJ7_9ZZZZ|nr:HAMP domain-containing protein [Actinomycetota bacterium]
MKGIRYALQHSLVTRVILSTVLLSLGVVWLTGSALYSRLADGIRSTSLNSSIAESRYTFFNADYQMLASEGMAVEDRKRVLAEFVVSTSTQGINEERREVIFLKTPSAKRITTSYEMSSNIIKNSSIPADLRKRVQKTSEIQYAYAPAAYNNGATVDSLFVGEKIRIPGGGRYEMYIVFSLKNQSTTLDLIKNSLLLTGIALLLLIALITWLVVRQVVRPVRDAARIATQFTQGDYSQRMTVTSTDEMASLANSYNEMAHSIEQQISRLEHLSRVQQRFVSDVTHELRTPLTTLRMASEVIHNQRQSFDPLVARSSELLAAQLDRFERLLEDLLEVSRFDAEVAVLEPIEFDVVSLIKRCAKDFDVSNDSGLPEIQVRSENEIVTIKADIRRVERIMRNLLSNALDHSEGKEIIVNVVSTDSEVGIGVRDFGSGLDESALIRVFDRFWRADPSRARIRGGTGLGLSISLEDARLHNGELDAWGRPGLGAHFVLTLPRKAGDAINARPIKAVPIDFHQESFYQ